MGGEIDVFSWAIIQGSALEMDMEGAVDSLSSSLEEERGGYSAGQGLNPKCQLR